MKRSKKHNMQNVWFISIACVCMAFLAIFTLTSGYSDRDEEPISFSLTSHTGEPYSSVDDPKFKLVFFGFTHCPDVCPTGVTNMHKVKERIGAASEELTPIFITVDPERDDPAAMNDYLRHFHADFLGLTGSEEELKATRKKFKSYAKKVQPPGYDEYFVDHSAHIYLLGKDDILVDVFDYRMDTPQMIQRIISHM